MYRRSSLVDGSVPFYIDVELEAVYVWEAMENNLVYLMLGPLFSCALRMLYIIFMVPT